MSSTEKFKLDYSIKWIICGTLELLYTICGIFLFTKYDVEFLTQSFIYLDIICAIVKSMASAIFIATLHKKVSAYSIPIITAMVTHGVLIPILVYYTFKELHTRGLSATQMSIMFIKFIWFIFEIVFICLLLNYWNKVQISKLSKKKLNWNRSSKSESKTRKLQDDVQNQYSPPEEDQKKRYNQNQLYIHKCLQQNTKKTSVNYSQKSLWNQSLDESEVYRVKSKSTQSRRSASSQIDTEEIVKNVKQKQLRINASLAATNVKKNEAKDIWVESEDTSTASVDNKNMFF